MNKNLHRIIFNVARGIRMVVQETAASASKGGLGATSIATVVSAALLSMAGASAQIVGAPNVPGNLRPTVLVAPNGVPLVNIQTPSAAGVSRNIYTQFDVGARGVILNNSRLDARTELGGWVPGNPSLATGPARVILNEINSGNPSQLRGYIEVGGSRAEVIIANPAGIRVDGGGFINASKATLTTGTPQFGALGSLDSFVVRGGTVSVDGAGLDLATTDYAAILARAVNLNAALHANDLEVVTGANQISADHGRITPTAGTGAAPGFALDVAALGGMYARKIVLVGSEAGLGVRNAGNIGAMAGNLIVTAAGRIENSGTMEGTRVQLGTPGDIVNQGTIRQASSASLAIAAPRLSNTNSGWIGMEPVAVSTDANAVPGSGGTSAGGTSPGVTSAGTGTASTTSSSSTAIAGVAASPGAITAGGALLNDGGKIYAGGVIDLQTQSPLNSGGTLGVASLALDQPGFSNHGGTLNVSGALTANVGTFDNSSGTVRAGSLTIKSTGDLLNVDGTLTSDGDADVTVGGNLANTRGSLSATGALTARVTGALSNIAGTLGANTGLRLAIGSVTNDKGAIRSAAGPVQLEVAGAMSNGSGSIVSATTLTVQAASLSNDRGGSLRGNGDLRVTASGALTNAGSLTSGHDVGITVASAQSVAGSVLGAGIEPAGTLATTGDLGITATHALVANGTQLAAGNARLQGARIDLGGGTTDADNIALTATNGDVSASSGKVVTPGTLTVIANRNAGQTLVNDAGTLHAGQLQINVSNITNAHGGEIVQTGAGGTTLAVSETLNNDGGRIASNSQDLTLSGASVLNAGGKIEHAGTGTLALEGVSFHGANGQITGNGALAVKLSGTFNQDGGRTTARQITIDADAIRNRGGEIVQTGTGATGISISISIIGGLDNTNGILASNADTTIVAGSLTNQGGRITAVGDLAATVAGAASNRGGTLAANGNTTVKAAGLDNSSGKVFGDNIRLDTQGQPLSNVQGTIGAIHAMDLQTGALSNDAGLIQSGEVLTIDTHGQALSNNHAAGYVNGQGGITSADTLRLAAGTVTNTAGRIQAVRDLSLTSGGIDNSGGLIRSLRTTTLNASQIVNANTQGTDRGVEGKNVALDVTTLDNSAGAIRSDFDTTITSAGSVANSAGLISAGGTLALLDSGRANPSAKRLAVTNAGGMLIANDSLQLDAKTLSGDGTITSAGDLSIVLAQDLVNDSKVSANGDLTYATSGSLTNHGQLLAGGTLTVGGTTVDNTASGEMTGTDTTVNAATLNNRGLIDGRAQTRINAGVVNNVGSGRIYGDHVAMTAGILNNDTETVGGRTKSGAIASRGNLDLGVGTLNNREHALIFSVGDMSIGGSLDASGEAIGRASAIHNASATIESLGNMKLAADAIHNVDAHMQVVRIDAPAVSLPVTIIPTGLGVEIPWDSQVYTDDNRNWAAKYDGQTHTGKGWTVMARTETTHTDVAANPADPGRIVSGGDMLIDTGILRNRDSRVLAGSKMTVDPTAVDNTPTRGQKIVDNGGSYILVPGVKGNNLVPGVIPNQESRYSIDIGTSERAEFVNAASGTGPGATNGVNVNDRAGSIGGVNGGTRAGVILEVASAVDVHLDASGRTVDGAVGTAGASGTAGSNLVSLVVRTSTPTSAIPTASLFGVDAGTGRYLVATDPRFSNYRDWLSSDYLLDQLGLSPDHILKRLGDGFYEQKLIREQVAQLTGYRYLDGLANDEAQYTALMNSGATFAKRFGLVPGVALTADQMAQLTSDIVWLVEQTATLPDGSTQKVLAPQVYVRVQPGDITGGGSLLSADAMLIRGGGDLDNRGTIAGRSLVSINAGNVNNLGGRITGGGVDIDVRTDLNNIGGTISAADSARLSAGRNIRIETTTQSSTGANGTTANRTGVDRIAGVYVTHPGGVLIASAGNDVDVVAGILSSAGSVSVGAGRNIDVTTVTESASRSMAAAGGSGKSRAAVAIIEGSSNEVGSVIAADGNVRLAAGNDLNIRASAVTSNDGALIATARNDINLSAGQSTTSLASGVVSSSRSLVKKSSSSNLDGTSATDILSSRLRGQSVELSAGHDLDAQAARISAQNAVTLSAARDVNLSTANSTGQAMHLSQSRTSSTGLAQAWAISSDAGGPVGGYGNRQSSANSTSSWNTQTAVGTIVSAGSAMVAGGRDTRVAGSTMVADGDITVMAGRNLSIESAQSHTQSSSSSASARSGFLGSWSSPGLGHIKTFEAHNGSRTTQERSQVASLGGDVTLVAGNEYRQGASQVMAGRQDVALIGGNVDIRARNVRIEEAYDTEQDNAVQRSGSTQLGGSVSASFGGAGVTMTDPRRGVSTTGALSSIKALNDTDDRRAQALGALSAATMAGQAYDAATSGATSATLNSGVSVSLSRNDSRSVSASNSSTAVGSSVVGTGRVDIEAAGGGEDSKILVNGSSVTAGQTARLAADGDVTLQASSDSLVAVGNSASHGANVGVTFGVGAQNGLSIQLGVSQGRGSDNQTETRYNVAQVSGADAVDIRSGGDLALRGAVVTAGRVAADVGGNLDITTLQDVRMDRRSQSSSGVNLSLCIPPICYGALVTGSASTANARQNGVTISPNTQSGIRAGDGGFDLNVRGNTNLAGGIVASAQAAIDAERNRLRTGTLTTSDLLNISEGGARSSSASVDYSSAAEFGKYQAVKTLASNAVANGSANSSAAGVTRAAVSAGSVTIDNEAGQLAATGRTAEASIAALNRNTAQANQPVAASDMQALQRRAITNQLIKGAAVDQITVQTDAAYEALFVIPPRYFRVSCGGTTTECMQDPSKLIREEIDEATAKREGTVIAVNGIFNSAERAAQLAYQNAAVDGDKVKPERITLLHIGEARTTVGELMVATYERYIAPTLGYSNADNAYADLLQSRGNQETVSMGHSRGAIVQANAFSIAADAGYTNDQLVARAVGPGTPASIYVPAATRIVGERNALDNINYTYLANDPVAVIAAGNPGDVWAAFREFINVIRTNNSAHSCYGTGAQGCATIANPVPSGPVPTHQQPGSIITIRGGSQ